MCNSHDWGTMLSVRICLLIILIRYCYCECVSDSERLVIFCAIVMMIHHNWMTQTKSRNHVNVMRVKKIGEIKSVFDYTISNGEENSVMNHHNRTEDDESF